MKENHLKKGIKNERRIIAIEIALFAVFILILYFVRYGINSREIDVERDVVESSVLDTFNQYGYVMNTLDRFYRNFESGQMTHSDLESILGEDTITSLGVQFATIAPNDIHEIIYPYEGNEDIVGKTLTETVENYLIGQFYQSSQKDEILVMRSLDNDMILFAKSIREDDAVVGTVLVYVDYNVFKSKTITLFNSQIFDIELLDANESNLIGSSNGEYYQEKIETDEMTVHLSLAVSDYHTSEVLSTFFIQAFFITIVAVTGIILTHFFYKKNREFVLELNNIAYVDSITNLYNRKQLEEDIKYHISDKKSFNLGFAKLDNIKHFVNRQSLILSNDSLLAVVEIINQNVSEDINVYLYSDDTLVLIDVDAQPDRLKTNVEKIVKIFEEPIVVMDTEFSLAINAGLLNYPHDGNSYVDLVKKGDYIINIVKGNSYNSCATYSEMFDEDTLTVFDIDNLVKEMPIDAIQVYLQPFIDVKTSNIVGFECLSRQFVIQNLEIRDIITSFESSGRIRMFDYYVIRTAIKYLSTLEIDFPDVFISVNISPINLNYEMVNFISSLIREFKVNPKNLVIEVLESANITRIDTGLKVIEGLSELGIRVSLDDFGTGYSSLEMISSLPLDFLKVDKRFFEMKKSNSFEQILLSSLVEIGVKVGYKLVAEGIETKEQYTNIKKLGYDLCQGYHFYKAMPFVKAVELLNDTMK